VACHVSCVWCVIKYVQLFVVLQCQTLRDTTRLLRGKDQIQVFIRAQGAVSIALVLGRFGEATIVVCYVGWHERVGIFLAADAAQPELLDQVFLKVR